MKTDREFYETVIRRAAEREIKEMKTRKRAAGILSAAAALALVLAAGISIGNGIKKIQVTGEPVKSGSESTQSITFIPTTVENENVIGCENGEKAPAETSSAEAKSESSTAEQKTAAGRDGGSAGEEYGGPETMGGPFIPAMPKHTGANPGVSVTGEKVTDEDAAKWFEENKTSLASSLSASGVNADSIRMSGKGYGHVSYDGVEGKPLQMKQDFRDYLIYNGDELIAILTVTKENGKLYATPAFGAPWFASYNNFLQKHKGEKLLYVYAGYMEIIITPENECYSTVNYDITDYLEGKDNPYEYFYAEQATYVP